MLLPALEIGGHVLAPFACSEDGRAARLVRKRLGFAHQRLGVARRRLSCHRGHILVERLGHDRLRRCQRRGIDRGSQQAIFEVTAHLVAWRSRRQPQRDGRVELHLGGSIGMEAGWIDPHERGAATDELHLFPGERADDSIAPACPTRAALALVPHGRRGPHEIHVPHLDRHGRSPTIDERAQHVEPLRLARGDARQVGGHLQRGELAKLLSRDMPRVSGLAQAIVGVLGRVRPFGGQLCQRSLALAGVARGEPGQPPLARHGGVPRVIERIGGSHVAGQERRRDGQPT